MYILKNWQIIRHLDAEGLAIVRLGGEAFGNPRFPPGAAITTSSIVEYRAEAETLIVSTSNGSTYVLGRPNTYEPFARQRLLSLLQTHAGGQPVGPMVPASPGTFDPQRTDLQLGAGRELRHVHAALDVRPRVGR